jgi:hypothetical protein
MPVQLSQGNCQYALLTCTSTATATTATSTFTLNAGQGKPAQGVAGLGPPGAFYGVYSLAIGTYTVTSVGTSANSIYAAYDIVPAATGTASTTYTMATGTFTSAGAFSGPTGVSGNSWPGVRYNGALVITLTGASNSTCNALWD